jgi:hypothetical protein
MENIKMDITVNNMVDVVTKDGRTVQVDMTTPANWKQQLRAAYYISELVFKDLSLPAYDYKNPQPTDLKKLHQGIANRAKKALKEYAEETNNGVVVKKMVNDLLSCNDACGDDTNDTQVYVYNDVRAWLTSPKSKKISTLNLHYLIGQEKTAFSSSLGFDSEVDDKLTEKKVVDVEHVAETKPVVVTIDGKEYEDRTEEMTNGYKEVMKELEALKNEAVEVEPAEIVEPAESVDMEEVSDLLDGLSPAQIALLKNRLNQPE